MAQLHLCSRQDGPHMTGCIGIYSTCTSTSLQLQPLACGNETSSITCINTPHLCNAAKQFPCAWSKHELDHVQSSFVQCSLRWISSDIGPSCYQSIKKKKKLPRKIREGIASSLVMSKDMPRNNCLCTRLALHKAGMNLAAAQNCSWAL